MGDSQCPLYSDTKWLSTGDSAKRSCGSRHRNDWLSASDWVALSRRNTQLPFGSLLFCPEVGGDRAVGVHTLLTMNTLLTIAWGIVKRVWTIVNRVFGLFIIQFRMVKYSVWSKRRSGRRCSIKPGAMIS